MQYNFNVLEKEDSKHEEQNHRKYKESQSSCTLKSEEM